MDTGLYVGSSTSHTSGLNKRTLIRGMECVGCVWQIARFSEAFVLLRARSVGVPVAAIPTFAIANNLLQAVLAYPFGCLADKTDVKVPTSSWITTAPPP
jgi:hypothetical protein